MTGPPAAGLGKAQGPMRVFGEGSLLSSLPAASCSSWPGNLGMMIAHRKASFVQAPPAGLPTAWAD